MGAPASLRNLQNLTSLTIYHERHLTPVNVDALRNLLLSHCPLLQDLYLDGYFPPKSSTIPGYFIMGWHIHFVTRHPLLESLWLLGDYTFLSGCILPHTLSKLHRDSLVLHRSFSSITSIEVAEPHFIWTKLTPHDRISHMAQMPQFQDMYDRRKKRPGYRLTRSCA
ncbi:hypothetical protein M422DRAFT_238997 [Sphaerobolus stellatus SS14]|nr:hypothetical protein M422DRAFT_238997 [Sphaerobolus stellatus SS14]